MMISLMKHLDLLLIGVFLLLDKLSQSIKLESNRELHLFMELFVFVIWFGLELSQSDIEEAGLTSTSAMVIASVFNTTLSASWNNYKSKANKEHKDLNPIQPKHPHQLFNKSTSIFI